MENKILIISNIKFTNYTTKQTRKTKIRKYMKINTKKIYEDSKEFATK